MTPELTIYVNRPSTPTQGRTTSRRGDHSMRPAALFILEGLGLALFFIIVIGGGCLIAKPVEQTIIELRKS
jgi:hypothetical protein